MIYQQLLSKVREEDNILLTSTNRLAYKFAAFLRKPVLEVGAEMDMFFNKEYNAMRKLKAATRDLSCAVTTEDLFNELVRQ